MVFVDGTHGWLLLIVMEIFGNIGYKLIQTTIDQTNRLCISFPVDTLQFRI